MVSADLQRRACGEQQRRQMNHSIMMKPSGRLVDPWALTVEDIELEDIAHHLSKLCRFAGGIDGDEIYSVAQHSVLVSNEVEVVARDLYHERKFNRETVRQHVLYGLLHDASEAYLIDVPRPLKHRPEMGPYREAERRAMAVVCARFALAAVEPGMVQIADRRMCDTESRDLRGVIEGKPYPHISVRPWTPLEARSNFLRRFRQIAKEWGRGN